jgi:hypothetical protein
MAGISVEDLKKDQEQLQKELDKLDSFLTKKKPGKKTGKKEEPVKAKPAGPSTDELLKQHLEENKKIMEKFNYLMEVLMSTSEEEKNSDVDEVVVTLAKTQSHALEVLANIKQLLEKTDQGVSSKQELEEFEQEQAARYNELNKKINVILEKVEKPSYLQELDLIRIGVSNIISHLKKLESQSGATPEINGVKKEVDDLSKKVDNIEQSLHQVSQPQSTQASQTSQQDYPTAGPAPEQPGGLEKPKVEGE